MKNIHFSTPSSKTIAAIILAVGIGAALGIFYGWVINPVVYIDNTPDTLRADIQEDFLRAAIDSYRLNPDPVLAVRRWQSLGPNAAPLFHRIEQYPSGQSLEAIKEYRRIVEASLGPMDAQAAPAQAPDSGLNPYILPVAVVLIMIVDFLTV
jgi:hypothetical protein